MDQCSEINVTEDVSEAMIIDTVSAVSVPEMKLHLERTAESIIESTCAIDLDHDTPLAAPDADSVSAVAVIMATESETIPAVVDIKQGVFILPVVEEPHIPADLDPGAPSALDAKPVTVLKDKPASAGSRLRGAATAVSLSSFGLGLGSLKGLADGVSMGAAVNAVKNLAATPLPSGASGTGSMSAKVVPTAPSLASTVSQVSVASPAPKPMTQSATQAPVRTGAAVGPQVPLQGTPTSSFDWSAAARGLLPSSMTGSSPSSRPATKGADTSAAQALARLCDLDLGSGPTHSTIMTACCAGTDITHLVSTGIAVVAWYRVYPAREAGSGAIVGFRYLLLADVKAGKYQPSVDDVGCRLIVKARATASGRGLLRSSGLRDRVTSAFGMAECPAVEMDGRVPMEAEKRTQLGAARFRVRVYSDSSSSTSSGDALHVAVDPSSCSLVLPDSGVAASGASPLLKVSLDSSVHAWAEPSVAMRVHVRYTRRPPVMDQPMSSASVQAAACDKASTDSARNVADMGSSNGDSALNSSVVGTQAVDMLGTSNDLKLESSSSLLSLDLSDSFARDVFLLVLRAWLGPVYESSHVSLDPAGDLAKISGCGWKVTDAPADDIPSDDEGDDSETTDAESSEGKPRGSLQATTAEIADVRPGTETRLGLDQFLAGNSIAGSAEAREQMPIGPESSALAQDDTVEPASIIVVGEQASQQLLKGNLDILKSDALGVHESTLSVVESVAVVSPEVIPHSAYLQDQLAESKSAVASLFQQLSSTKNDLARQSQSIVDLEARVAAFGRERAGMERSLTEAQADNRKIAQELVLAKQKLMSSADRLAAAEADIKHAREATRLASTQAQQATATVTGVKAEVESCRSQLKEAVLALEVAKEDAASKAKALKAMSSTADEAKVKAVAFARELTSCQEQLKELHGVAEAAREDATAKAKALKATTAANDESKNKLAALASELSGLRISYASEVAALSEKAANDLQSIKSSQGEDSLALASAREAHARAKLSSTEATARATSAEYEAARLRTERDDLRGAMQAATDRTAAAERQERAAREACEGLQAKMSDAQGLSIRIVQLEKELKASAGLAKQARIEVEIAQAAADEARIFASQLKEELATVSSSADKVAAADAAALKAKQDAEAAVAEKNAATRKMESLRRDLARVMSGAEELQLSTVEEMITSKKALEAKVVRLSEEAAGLRDALAEAYLRTAPSSGGLPSQSNDGRKGEVSSSAAASNTIKPSAGRPGFIAPTTPVKPAPGTAGSSGGGGFGFLSPPPTTYGNAGSGTAMQGAASESAMVKQLQAIIANLTEQVHDRETALAQQRSTKEALAGRIRELETIVAASTTGAQ